MQSPKLGVVFVGFLIIVAAIVTLPQWGGFLRGRVTQVDQDRRAAASGDVWCYTHMLDSVTGHPPGLTREEIIAYNPAPPITDYSIADTNDRTDCFESWTAAWEATDPALQNMFRRYLPDNPTEDDYAEVLPLSMRDLDRIDAERTAQAANDQLMNRPTEPAVDAAATEEALVNAEGFNDEGTVWCFTLLRKPDDIEGPYGNPVAASHPPGQTLDQLATGNNPAARASVVKTSESFQRACLPTFKEAVDFFLIMAPQLEGALDDLTTEEQFRAQLLALTEGNWVGVSSGGNELSPDIERAFAEFGEPLPITFEVDPVTLANMESITTVPLDHPRAVWCATFLRGPYDYVAGTHPPGLSFQQLADIGVFDESQLFMRDHEKVCFPNFLETVNFYEDLLSEDFFRRLFSGVNSEASAEAAVKDTATRFPRFAASVEAENERDRFSSAFAGLRYSERGMFEGLADQPDTQTASDSEGNIWCETLLRGETDADPWALVPHEPGAGLTDIVIIAANYPATEGYYTRYQMACFDNFLDAGAFTGTIKEFGLLIDASTREQPDPVFAEAMTKSFKANAPASPIADDDKERIAELFAEYGEPQPLQ